MEEYNEENTIRHIRECLPEDVASKYTDDEYLAIIDAIWDYYDDNGMLSLDELDDETDDASDMGDMTKGVSEILKDYEIHKIPDEDLELIIKAEIDYEEKLDNEI